MCLKCESGSSSFQPGKGPSRGLLRDYEPLEGPFSSPTPLTHGPDHGDPPGDGGGQGGGGVDVRPGHREEDGGEAAHGQPAAQPTVHLHTIECKMATSVG